MKHLFYTLLLLIPFELIAQDKSVILENSAIEVNINNGNEQFKTPAGESSFYIKANGASTTYSTSLVMSGYDPSGNLMVSFSPDQTTAGPLHPDNYPIPGHHDVFNRFFLADATEINLFRIDFRDGVINNEIPFNILAWAGTGNPHFESIFGIEIPDTYWGHAPFFDQDGDGIYNPLFGDFPLIKNADKACYFVYNFYVHTDNTVNAVRSDIQVLARIYETDDDLINHAIFYDYRFRMARDVDLYNFRYGMFINPALGCPEEDYIGYDEANDFVFAYNQDALDGDPNSNCNELGQSFQDETPVMIYSLIEKPLILVDDSIVHAKTDYFIAYDSSDINTRRYADRHAIYKNMNGAWLDDTMLTEGGTGYNPNSSETVHYCYPGNPSKPEEWSMCALNTPLANRQSLLSSESSLGLPGAIFKFTFTAFAHFPVDRLCFDISTSESLLKELKSFNRDQENLKDPTIEERSCLLVPNLVSPGENVQVDCNFEVEEIFIFSELGQLLDKPILSLNSEFLKAPSQGGLYFILMVNKAGKSEVNRLLVR